MHLCQGADEETLDRIDADYVNLLDKDDKRANLEHGYVKNLLLENHSWLADAVDDATLSRCSLGWLQSGRW